MKMVELYFSGNRCKSFKIFLIRKFSRRSFKMNLERKILNSLHLVQKKSDPPAFVKISSDELFFQAKVFATVPKSQLDSILDKNSWNTFLWTFGQVAKRVKNGSIRLFGCKDFVSRLWSDTSFSVSISWIMVFASSVVRSEWSPSPIRAHSQKHLKVMMMIWKSS